MYVNMYVRVFFLMKNFQEAFKRNNIVALENSWHDFKRMKRKENGDLYRNIKKHCSSV